MESVQRRAQLLRRGVQLEYLTLAWNVAGTALLISAALWARSVALVGFGLDSLIEIFASLVVVWQLKGATANVYAVREREGLRMIGWSFLALVVYVLWQALYVLAEQVHPGTSELGLVWLGATVAVMLLLAWGKHTTGRELDSAVLNTEARVTFVDGCLALVILMGVALNALVGWWWADPIAALIMVPLIAKEGWDALLRCPA
jgi:divalent metal cation (Fe/Co/Zn/Cd) transporter